MNPVKFKGCNVTFAKNQPEYLPLPAHRNASGKITVCYRLSVRERIIVLLKGKIWFQSLTFNKPLQPQKLSTYYPYEKEAP